MSRLRLPALLLAAALLAACSREKAAPVVSSEPSATAAPQASAAETAQRYFQLWSSGQYDAMYDLLSAASRQAIARDRFTGRHEGIAEEARITVVKATPSGSVDSSSDRAQANFTVVYTTALWGDLPTQQNTLPLTKERDGWRIDWSPSLIFRELTGGNLVRAVLDTPQRGAILDRSGTPLALTGTAPTVGTAKNLLNVPSIVPNRDGLIAFLGNRLGIPAEEIRAKADDPKTQYDIFIPLKTLPPNTPAAQITELENTPGVVVQNTPRRVYPYGAAAAHVVGYAAPITAEQLAKHAGEGYQAGDLIGGAGLEATFNAQLAGQRGARLTIITPEGGLVTELAKRPGTPARDLVTTLDIAAQLALDSALGDRPGSAVLLDPRDNGVVAMASHPAYDPNLFVTGIPEAEANRLLNDPRTPLINRAVGATYPPGSTFKVITAAAGLERGGYTPASRFACTPVWTGLGPNVPKKNWTTVDEGRLTVAEGLMRSCNPVFYEIGLTLDGIDPKILTQYAGAFGLGKPTGINGLDEASGVDPGPEWKQATFKEGWFSGDSVNMSIGQGFLLATPLQIANVYSTIAAGGPLRSTVLVKEQRAAGTSEVVETTTSKELGKAPVTPSTLSVLRQGTTMVAQDPRGTAYSVFAGSRLDPAGKSGTAEDQGLQSHVLFAAYAPRNAARGVAVVVFDDGQSGSLEAGPIARRILENWVLR